MTESTLLLLAWMGGLIVAVLVFVGAPELLVAVTGFVAPVTIALYARNQRNRRDEAATEPAGEVGGRPAS
jgi:hypothetical protein